MCGIAGLVSFEEEARRFEARFDAMQRSIAPRGPDQQGRYVDERAALLHTRLAVVDVEHGTQPMREREYTLIYNGELYNAPELRQELEAAGARLHTRIRWWQCVMCCATPPFSAESGRLSNRASWGGW